MKASELRLGNLIHLNGIDYDQEGNKFHDPLGDVVIEVTMIDTMQVSYGERKEADTEDCSGISLTEQWLTKFGWGTDSEPEEYGIYQQSDGSYSLIDDYGDGATYYVGSMKYVHQLQNLYFALTGEELEIKP